MTKPKPIVPSSLPPLFASLDWEGGHSLVFKLKRIVFQALKDVFPQVDLPLQEIKLTHPAHEDHGDYSANLALVLAGRLRMKPKDVAEKLKTQLEVYIRKYQMLTVLSNSNHLSDGKITPSSILEKIEVAGGGFINLWLKRQILISELFQLLEKENAGKTTQKPLLGKNLPLTQKKIMIEFAHPNTHKEFHIGHLRNISIGESIVRTLKTMGASLFRANYEGDIGLHVAKAIWGVATKIEKERLEIAILRELNPGQKAKFLGEAYALGSRVYDESEEAKKEIMSLNIKIYQNPHKVDLWQETRRWSLEYFDTVYQRVGTCFDRLFFESEVEAIGRREVKEAVSKGIFIKDSDGSIFFPGKKYGLNNCVFVTKEDYATYEGKEVALEELEFATFPFDLNIHVVANEQKNFFQIVFKALELLQPGQKGRQYHLAYGMVNLKSGKISSRTGQVITADFLIDEAKKKVLEILHQNGSKYSQSQENEIAEKVAVSAVKYSMLKVNPKMDIAFDLEESVSFEGDSGPYLLYTYARCKSVLRKAEGEEVLSAGHGALRESLNNEELALLRLFYRYEEVVMEAARTLSPNLICHFLFDLAQKYNLFYHQHSILTPKATDLNKAKELTEFRLAITAATAKLLQKGLFLLGVETVEKM